MHLLILFLIKLLIHVTSVQSSSNISLCHDVPLGLSNLSTITNIPEIVVLREHNSNDIRMTSALDDVDCWLKKNFKIVGAYTVETRGADNETICYSMATVNIKVKQLMVVISEGQSAQNCTPSVYGPIPNILNIKMFVDGTKNDSVRRMELSFRNPGGHVGVQFEFHRRSVVSKIQKTIEFMLKLNNQTSTYSQLIPYWNPTIFLPPASWQYRKLGEEKEKLEAENMSISWVLVVSVMPMIFFGVVVSCYIVIQPRGGLTYTDEEIDFSIQEVDSASRVNVLQPKIHPFKITPIVYVNPTHSTETNSIDIAMEPTIRRGDALKTAVDDDIHTDKTMLSEGKSTKTVRLPPKDTGTTSVETISLRTGRD